MLRKLSVICCLLIGFSSPLVDASTLDVEFELPSFDSADYNKPYVAIWLEQKPNNKTLLLWHLKRKQEDKWLVDIRRWWRKLGRYGETPDAYTGATKGPGKYQQSFQLGDEFKAPFTFYIEVVREDGGRSLLKQKIGELSSQKQYILAADKEIGEVTITVVP